MHVAAGWAGKLIHACQYCDGPILQGSKIYRGYWYYRRKRHTWYWHLACYFDESNAYLDMNPYVPKQTGNGRPVLDITLEDRRVRKQLLNRGSYLRKLMQETVKFSLPGWEVKLASINTTYNEVADKLEPIGGVPRSWFS